MAIFTNCAATLKYFAKKCDMNKAITFLTYRQ